MHDLNFQLKQICSRNHDGSYGTRAVRERNLSLMANQLHELGYKGMNSHSLKAKHVNSLLKLWTDQGLASGTIKNRMAHLRWWAEKVNKYNVLPKSNDSLGIERRVYVTNENKGKFLPDDVLAKISDERVKISLKLQEAFGLRAEESIKFHPVYADKGDHISLKSSWCKGGQARTVPILTSQQREVLDQAHKIAGRAALIPKNFTYIAQLNKYKAECYRAGFSKMHGLRHGYAQRRYQELTGWAAPAAGGPTADQLSPEQKTIDHQARMTVSEELGHHREDVTAVYLGR